MSETDHLHNQSIHNHHVYHGHHTHGLTSARAASHSHTHGHHSHVHDIHIQGEPHTQAEVQTYLGTEHIHMHAHEYGHAIRHGDGNGIVGEDHEEDPDEDGLDEGELHSDGGNGLETHTAPVAPLHGLTQLTLSYQGELYVFDAVPPEKVQAVLLLLGGREISHVTSGMQASGVQHNKGVSGVSELPTRMDMPQRLASLRRFREKRKERCFDKKIRYTIRKEVAQRMQRKKGQFVSSRMTTENGIASSDSNGCQPSGQQAGAGTVHKEVICVHCGIGERSTPMMRRGPAGPRTLCNACGLMWANKGVLRDLSKSPQVSGMAQQAHMNQQIGGGQPAAKQQQQIAGMQQKMESDHHTGRQEMEDHSRGTRLASNGVAAGITVT